MYSHPERPIGNTAGPEKRKSSPFLIALNLFLMGVTALFTALVCAYLFSSSSKGWSWEQFGFPRFFLLSTIFLVIASFLMHKTPDLHDREQGKQLIKYLLISSVFSLLFVICQGIGWWDLQAKGVDFGGKPDGSYLYLLTGLHALHVLGGLIWLLITAISSSKKLKNPVTSLLYFSETRPYDNLLMLRRYWHYIDLLWIILLVFFLLNHL